MKYDIALEDVQKKFGDQAVLRGINVRFEQGRIHGIIGRNGSGKTVLLKCIAGFIQNYTGRITIGGIDRKKLKMDQLRIGAIIEAPGFVPGYGGYANLKFFAEISGKAKRDEIIKVLQKVGLDPSLRKAVEKYSMGMRQRLGIAQAILEDPPLLLLDEPMNGLDNAGVQDMRALFRSLQEAGKTILLSSHNPLDIEALCDTVYEIDAGNLTCIRADPAP